MRSFRFQEVAQPTTAPCREIASESGTATGYTYTVTSAYPGPTLLKKASPEETGKSSPMRSRGDKCDKTQQKAGGKWSILSSEWQWS
eukprot:Skav230105  [mRNA]  locus=scaffold283:151375:152745:- [translate_table: standard]